MQLTTLEPGQGGGGAFLAPARNDPGAFQGRTLAFAVQLKGRRLWLGHILLKKPPPTPFAALHPLASRSVCDPTRLLPPSIHPSRGGGRRREAAFAGDCTAVGKILGRSNQARGRGCISRTNWLAFIYCCHSLRKWTREEIPGPRLLRETGSFC